MGRQINFLCCVFAAAASLARSLPPPSSSVVPLPFHEFAANNGDAAKVTFSCQDARRDAERANTKGREGIRGAVRVAAMPACAVAAVAAVAGDRLSAVPD